MPKGKTDKTWNIFCLTCKREHTSKQPFSKFCSNACKCKHYYPVTKLSKPKWQAIVYSCLRRDPNSEVTPEALDRLYEKQAGFCAITGFAFVEKDRMLGVSVDRIDPLGGYKLDNIRLVGRHANMMKSRLSDEELTKWCQSIVANLAKEGRRKGK